MKYKQGDNKKMILFGGGKIGRSFIGQLFSCSGYEVVFVDINQGLIDELNRRGKYSVVIKGNDTISNISVENVRGIHLSNREQIIEEVTTASILAISVGMANVEKLAPLISQSLNRRFNKNPNSPIDIIIGENMRHGAKFLHEKLSENLPSDFPLSSYVGMVETSIGKMVPIMTKKEETEDLLQVFAEPYNNLIVDRRGFKNSLPKVDGLDPKEKIEAWVDRKLFIHNLGHATAAYIGYIYNPDFKYIYEVLAEPQLKALIKKTMHEAADILLKMYPDTFTSTSLTDHIDDLVSRFENRHLKDTIYRVGQDLLRKLGSEDRFVGAIKMGHSLNMPTKNILLALVAGMFFRATDEQGQLFSKDMNFISDFDKGIYHILTNVCVFDPDKHDDIFNIAEEYFAEFKKSPKNILNYL